MKKFDLVCNIIGRVILLIACALIVVGLYLSLDGGARYKKDQQSILIRLNQLEKGKELRMMIGTNRVVIYIDPKHDTIHTNILIDGITIHRYIN